MMFDLLIKDGLVVDGSGNPWFRADVGVKGDRIAWMGRSQVEAEKKIDARGMIVSPGFIDIHAHSDFPLLAGPRAESVIHQGITTQLIGNCGMSAAPITESNRERIRGDIERLGLGLDWESLGEYLDRLERRGIAINVASMVGQGTIREAVMGYEDRRPEKTEMEEMKEMVAEAMEEGAWGLSSMVQFPPGCYADIDEIVELVKVAGRYGGIYTTHIRTWNYQGLREAAEVGERGGVPVEVNHYASSIDKEVEVGFQILEEARRGGVDITFDIYPYLAGSGQMWQGMPEWAFEGGGVDRLLDNLRNPETRRRIKEEWAVKLNELYRGDPWNRDYKKGVEWGTMVSIAKGNPKVEGRFIADIAEESRMDPYDVAFDILIESGGDVMIVGFHIREWNLEAAMMHSLSMFCTDGWALAPTGILGSGKPHPRSYGTYPRILARYVREKGVLGLEEAIRKMTYFPAQKLGLQDRGLIRKGMHADIVIFNPETVRDKATYQDPSQYPEGIEYVLVNGEIVIEKGEHTGRLPGEPLRRPF